MTPENQAKINALKQGLLYIRVFSKPEFFSPIFVAKALAHNKNR